MGWWKRADAINERHTPLLQERDEGDHWPILVVSLSLKRTRRSQTEPVVQELLDRYPASRDLLRADEDEMADLLRPLGLWRHRTDELQGVARLLAAGQRPATKADIVEWDGVGEYVANSYAIFVLDDETVDPTDEKLRRYLERRGQRSNSDAD